MRLLVLGGSVFLSRAVAVHALAAGHDVTCASRGRSGDVPAGATWVRVDRAEPDGLAPLAGREYDAVVDVSSRPSQVRRAVAALAARTGHYGYVSSGSAYADDSVPGQRAGQTPVHESATEEQDDPGGNDFANYGPCKVACERAVVSGVGEDRAFVCRAGLIIGPGDPSNRFPYWVGRLARGGDVLAPGRPDEPAQYVDVRDLAGWLVAAAETGLAGTYDGIGAPVTREHFLTHVAAGVGRAATFTWVDQRFLLDEGVRPWAGPRSLPLWLPVPEYAGFMSRDVAPSLAAGLRTRDVADSAAATLAWLDGVPEPPGGAGLTAADEAELLARWHAR